MAYATQLTLGTGNKVSLNYQSQEVSVSLTYQLEREDTDVLAVVQEKAEEVARAHQAAWRQLRDAKVKASRAQGATEPAPEAPASQAAQPPLQPQSEPFAPVPAPSPYASGNSSDEEEAEEAIAEPATPGQQTALRTLLSHIGWSEEQLQQHLSSHFSGASIEQLTQRQASRWLLELQRDEREKAQQRRLHPARLNGKP